MKLTRIVSIIAMAAALSACKTIDTPDGKIPAEYVDAAKAYEGTYSGHFDGAKGDLTLKLDDTTPVLTYSDTFGHDILGKGCGSAIGKLLSIDVSDSTPPTIESARFEFNPGVCPFLSRTIDVSISTQGNQTSLGLSAIRNEFQFYVPGETVCQHDHHGHTYCYQTPGHFETRFNYAVGSFKKAN